MFMIDINKKDFHGDYPTNTLINTRVFFPFLFPVQLRICCRGDRGRTAGTPFAAAATCYLAKNSFLSLKLK